MNLMLTLCPEQGSILVSRTILETLAYPKQIQILVNKKQKKLMLQSCSAHDKNAIFTPADPADQFEISCPVFLERIRKQIGWTDRTPKLLFGSYIPGQLAIIFDLASAQPTQLLDPVS